VIPGELKPVLTALLLPPAAPLLLALLGVLVAMFRRRLGLFVVTLGIAAGFLLSTNGMALVLARHLMPPLDAASPQQVQQVQAIVVLGGGVRPEASEYGVAQPGPHTLQRLRYGAWLARRTGRPLAFAGGIGWGAAGTHTEAEGTVARRLLQEEYGLALRWLDDQSRDTAENALRMAALLKRDNIRRIALVTDATHMDRASRAFRAAGLEVLPAPTDFPIRSGQPVLEWLPSVHGSSSCQQILREWLARQVARHS
jgi:uncharacterized SAM-binding protein YcdF (DUF218 family)